MQYTSHILKKQNKTGFQLDLALLAYLPTEIIGHYCIIVKNLLV